MYACRFVGRRPFGQGRLFILMTFLSTCLFSCTGYTGMLVRSFTDPLEPIPFRFADGSESIYYRLDLRGAEGTSEAGAVLFFIGGSGCHSHKYYLRDYLEALPLNVTVFGLQRRGVSDRSTGMFGCSDLFHEKDFFSQWVADQSEFFERVMGNIEPPKRVVLFGVSEGGSVAAAITAAHPSVTHLVVIGSGGMRQREELQILAKRGQFDPHIDERFSAVRQDPNNPRAFVYGHSYRYWSSVLDRDPLSFFSRVSVPILVGFGEADRSVPVEAARALEEGLSRTGRSNLTLVVYPGADHTLRANGKLCRPDFLRRMADWLEKK